MKVPRRRAARIRRGVRATPESVAEFLPAK
jgi:hypothetical protein